jgi:hypothetical protein
MSKQIYVCRSCGKQVTAKKGKDAPSCCQKEMEPLPFCTTVPNPEMSRFDNPDEPCADGTTPKKFKK